MVNLSQIETLPEILKLPIDGIGLLRSELMMMDLLSIRPLSDWLRPDRQAEFVEKLAARIQTFAAAVAPRPLFYRSYDDKGLTQTDREKTPTDGSLLPQRGTYGYQMDSRLFDLELKALKKVKLADFTNLRLVLPFVRSVEEIEFCQHRLQRAGLNAHHPIPLWIMAEVPSVLFQLPQYVKAGIQGIAIGTNDLSQLLLGIDRDSIFLDFYQAHCPPALLTALKQLIALSHSLGIPCSICGQAPIQYPAIIPLLIDWGVTALSVEPAAVAEIYTAIANTERSLYTSSNQTF
jgi:pyruvate,water dikinase